VFPVDTRSSREISEEEKRTAISVLLRKGTSQKEIAEIWGMKPPSMWEKIKKYHLDDEVSEMAST